MTRNKNFQEDVESYMKRNNIIDILEVNFETSKNNSESESTSTVVNGMFDSSFDLFFIFNKAT